MDETTIQSCSELSLQTRAYSYTVSSNPSSRLAEPWPVVDMENIAATPKVADTATETKEVEFATTDRHKIHGDVENDSHRAALEDNPEVPEALTWSKGLSIFVCTVYSVHVMFDNEGPKAAS